MKTLVSIAIERMATEKRPQTGQSQLGVPFEGYPLRMRREQAR